MLAVAISPDLTIMPESDDLAEGIEVKTVTANEAKTRFGELLLRSQREPVQISRNGKPVAIMISAEDFECIEALKLQLLQTRATRALSEMEESVIADGESFFNKLETGKFDNKE